MTSTAFPRTSDEICAIVRTPSSARADEFPRLSEGRSFLMGGIILARTAGSPSSPQTPCYARRDAPRLFVIPRAWERLTFPIGSWRAWSGALCPPHLCWFAQLKWDKAHTGAVENHGGVLAHHCPVGFFFFNYYFWQMCRGIVEPGESPNDILSLYVLHFLIQFATAETNNIMISDIIFKKMNAVGARHHSSKWNDLQEFAKWLKNVHSRIYIYPCVF